MTTSPESRAPQSAPELKPCPLPPRTTAARIAHIHWALERPDDDNKIAMLEHFLREPMSGWVFAAQLEEELARAPQAQWQPIETAPKDGTHIIAFHPDEGAIEAWWGKTGFQPDGYWRSISTLWCVESAPTHWQPLPQPPAAERLKGQS